MANRRRSSGFYIKREMLAKRAVLQAKAKLNSQKATIVKLLKEHDEAEAAALEVSGASRGRTVCLSVS